MGREQELDQPGKIDKQLVMKSDIRGANPNFSQN
jgi:hypothetical protein